METLYNLSPLFICLGFLAFTHGLALWLGSKRIWKARLVFEGDEQAYTPPPQIITREDPAYRSFDPTIAPAKVQND